MVRGYDLHNGDDIGEGADDWEPRAKLCAVHQIEYFSAMCPGCRLDRNYGAVERLGGQHLRLVADYYVRVTESGNADAAIVADSRTVIGFLYALADEVEATNHA